MRPEDLVHMANQIAANIQADTEEDAATAIANHLHTFWEPRMRSDLRAAIAAGRAEGLCVRAIQALEQL